MRFAQMKVMCTMLPGDSVQQVASYILHRTVALMQEAESSLEEVREGAVDELPTSDVAVSVEKFGRGEVLTVSQWVDTWTLGPRAEADVGAKAVLAVQKWFSR